MQDLMWDKGKGLFLDYDWKRSERNPHVSLAGFYPLWAGIATPEQAERVVREWLPTFECSGGLVTTLEAQEGRQWAYPNGWAPLQWIVTQGLERYGYLDDANRIRRKWCDLCARKLEETGSMWEKYNVVEDANPEGGLYGAVTGFGWTNAVFVDFARRLASSVE